MTRPADPHPDRTRRMRTRLSGHVPLGRRGPRRDGGAAVRRPGASVHARHALREGESLSRAGLPSRPRAAPAEAGRPQRRGAIRPRELGRGARRHRVTVAGDRRRVRRRSDPAVQLRRRAGAHPDGVDRPAAVRIDGLQRPRSEYLRRGGRRRPLGHDRVRHRHRSGRDRPQPVHRAVGDEHDRHEPPLLAVGTRSAASRREDRGGRSGPDADRGSGRLAPADQAGQRCGPGARDDARHHSRRPGGPRLRVAVRHRVRSARGARAAVRTGARGGHGWPAGERDRAICARVRHDAAVAAAAADRPRAPSQRRDAVSHAGLPAGAHRSVETSRRRPGAFDPQAAVRRPWTWTAC